MKTINVETLAGRCAPSSDFVSNRWLAIQTDPLLIVLPAADGPCQSVTAVEPIGGIGPKVTTLKMRQ
jgi:hypothetical protein